MRGMVVAGGGQSGYMLRTGRGRESLLRLCSPPIYLNNTLDAQGKLDRISPEHIAGIEVCPGTATIPHRYKTVGSVCGVGLMWTW